MSECPDCERYKASAALWRNKAYELSGKPLPWKPDEIWVGLTDDEIFDLDDYDERVFARAIEAKLKEKNR